jgi:Zn finger protein HypA/HybF involved in hydrogenase expression
MPGKDKSLWRRVRDHFRVPTFEEILEDSSEEIQSQPIQMNCPRCGEIVPFGNLCPKCGSPRHPTIDERA